jgi:GT2 family glycosyltransferase
MKDNSIIVIIPLYNIVKLGYWEDLKKSIDSILDSLGNVDFLLINNESQDNTSVLGNQFSLEREKVLFVDNVKNNGSAGAFSQGIKYAKLHDYQFAYLIDQDTLFDDLSVKELEYASGRLSKEYTVLCSAVYATEDKALYLPHFRVMFDKILCRFHPVATDLKDYKKIDAGGNTGVFVNLEAIGDIEMDENFFYHMEDYDFCLKVNKIKPIYLIPQSKIYHPNKYPKVSALKQLIDDLFVVSLVKREDPITCKNRNTIKVYERNSNSPYLAFKKIATCLIALLFPKYSFRKTKEALFPIDK